MSQFDEKEKENMSESNEDWERHLTYRRERVKVYTVEITGQFKYITEVEAESAEEAKTEAQDDMDLEGIHLDAEVKVVIINSVRVVSEKPVEK